MLAPLGGAAEAPRSLLALEVPTPMLALLFAAAAAVPTVEIAPGVHMPAMNFGDQKNHTLALSLGGHGLDTANVYGDSQQREVGQATRGGEALGLSRKDIFVTSKIECCPGGQFVGKVEGKLLCLVKSNATRNILHDYDVIGLDYLDLMLLHWPCDNFEDTVATYKALEPLVAAGKARAIGVSNFNSSALAALLPRVTVKPVINQWCHVPDSNPSLHTLRL